MASISDRPKLCVAAKLRGMSNWRRSSALAAAAAGDRFHPHLLRGPPLREAARDSAVLKIPMRNGGWTYAAAKFGQIVARRRKSRYKLLRVSPVRTPIIFQRARAAWTSEWIRCVRATAVRTSAAIVHQVELDVASAAIQLELPLALAVLMIVAASTMACTPAENDRRHCAENRSRRRSRPPTDHRRTTAHAASLVTVRQEEIPVAPVLYLTYTCSPNGGTHRWRFDASAARPPRRGSRE